MVDYAGESATSKAIHTYALDLCEVVPQITIRYIRAEAPNELVAFNAGVKRSTAPHVALLQPGDTVASTCTQVALDIFARDVVGLLFPKVHGGMPPEAFFPAPDTVNIAEIISGPFYYPTIFARRLALLELGPFRTEVSKAHAIKELYTRLLFRGWSVESAPELSVTAVSRDYSVENTELNNNRARIVELIRDTLKREFQSDPFSPIRASVRNPTPLFE